MSDATKRPLWELPGLQRLLCSPVAAVRPYLALKCTLLMLAFDLWLTRVSHAGRYGAGGFNVAHWGWLDAVQPAIAPETYLIVALLTGALCFAIAFAERPPRWLIGVAFLLHSWTWAMSMLDSYQHHYMLSLVLLAMIFFPRLTAEQALLAVKAPPRPAKKRKRKRKRAEPEPEAPSSTHTLLDPAPLVPAWGWVLLGASTAVVYAYTAYAKTDPEWLSGAALQRVLHLGLEVPPPDAADPLRPFRAVLGIFGIEGEPMWYLMGHGVVLVQIICSVGYLLSPLKDTVRSRWLDAFGFVAFFTALSFHLGAEYMDLQIGWFSWYMVGYAAFFFLPAKWLVLVARALIPMRGVKYGPEVIAARVVLPISLVLLGRADRWPLTAIGVALLGVWGLRYLLRGLWTDADATRRDHWVYGAVGVVASGYVGYAVDLPGAPLAGIAAAVAVGVGFAVLQVRKSDASKMGGYALGIAIGALSLLTAISLSEVRWDYYRNVGGDHRRRGEPLAAYVAYVKANRYAPEGEDRRRQENEMRAALEAEGTPVPEVP